MAEEDISLIEEAGLPRRGVQRLSRSMRAFMHVESTAGVVLVLATVAALVIANTGLAGAFSRFWDTKLTFGLGGFVLSYPLWYWVNDGLMTIFFFVIGLEIKRELVVGELSDRRKVALPVFAAVGGATLPALIYLAVEGGGPGRHGWGIPTATDIAFVVGCLSLLGSRVPRGLKVLLLSLAIIDDLLAVLVIALFYTEGIQLVWLGAAGAGFFVVWIANHMGIRPIPIYVLMGSGIWVCMLKSGIHPTIGGVFLGFMTPSVPLVSRHTFREILALVLRRPLDGAATPPRAILEQVSFATREATSPLERLENAFHPWVGFFIMPVFALANAAVPIRLEALGSSVALAVTLGLVVGKPLGILSFSGLAAALGWGRLPQGVTWRVMVGAGLLGGVGFTMSLFIAALGLQGELLEQAKMGIILGSLLSIGLGLFVLRLTLPAPTPTSEAPAAPPESAPDG